MAERTATYERLVTITIVLVIAVLSVYQLRRTGALIEAIDASNARANILAGDVAELHHRLDINNENLSALCRDIELALRPGAEADVEPSDVLGVAGIPVDEWYFTLRVKAQTYLFPRNADAARQLRDMGFKAHRLTPYLTGYKLD
jgi:hypothetical protein